MVEIEKSIYTFPIVLPENPLKWLNCYVIKGIGGGRNLLIDTGFHRPECFSALLAGFRDLELQPDMTDVFLTHLHADHCGNAGMMQKMGCRLLMGKTDYDLMMQELTDGWQNAKIRAILEGMTESTVDEVFTYNPAVLYASEYFEVDLVREGDVLEYGGYRLEVISTPGHTPGHLCLYEPERQFMFTGDHVLFDITPNISFWPTMEDALGIYLDNLRKIDRYPVKRAYPGHRNTLDMTMHERVQQLLRHHEERLQETERIIAENPGLTGYEIAARMKWKIRCDSWEDFPPAQKWFAVCEAISHLEYLEKRRRIERRETETGTAYCCC